MRAEYKKSDSLRYYGFNKPLDPLKVITFKSKQEHNLPKMIHYEHQIILNL